MPQEPRPPYRQKQCIGRCRGEPVVFSRAHHSLLGPIIASRYRRAEPWIELVGQRCNSELDRVSCLHHDTADREAMGCMP